MKHIQNLKLGLRKLFIMECFNRLKAAGYKLSLTEILCQLFQKHDINMFGGNPKKYLFSSNIQRGCGEQNQGSITEAYLGLLQHPTATIITKCSILYVAVVLDLPLR